MVVLFSPHRDGGGTLHFPSPSNSPHSAPPSALEQLRQSLSRSPSKGPAFRLITSKSSSPTPNSPLSPTHRSPANRPETLALVTNPKSSDASASIGLFPPSTKKKRINLRHLSPMRSSSRSHSAARSPARRALSNSSDNGNATPQSTMNSGLGTENRDQPQQAVTEKQSPVLSDSATLSSDENLLAPYHAISRRERQGAFLDVAAKSSPLKRSDASAHFDFNQASSPSAKRRSLHGVSFGSDFNIFDQANLFEPPSPSRSVQDTSSQALHGRETLNLFTPAPRRASSLRKTTLQQRHDATPARSRLTAESFLDTSPSASATKAGNRLSLEFPAPPISRGGLFSNDNPPDASIRPIAPVSQENSDLEHLTLPQRHPLSKTVTQSSSNSEFEEDSPTHAPVRPADLRRPRPEMTKSLPVGAIRPTQRIAAGAVSSEESSFATPDNYKLAKPLPEAFLSTGLISKKNKNFDNQQLDFGESIGHMPDTPCKRPTSMASMAPDPTPGLDLNKSRQSRHTLPSFGTPSKPFNLHTSRPTVLSSKGNSIFGSGFNKNISRRSSFISSDFEDYSRSPSTNFQHQHSVEFDSPPTPTKQLPRQISVDSMQFEPTHLLRSPQPTFKDDRISDSTTPNIDCKSISITGKKAMEVGDVNNNGDESPSTTLRFRSLDSIPTFSKRPQAAGRVHCPTPLAQSSLSLPLISKHAKQNTVSAASPIMERQMRYSPRTPLETMVPPDPSGLSISVHGEKAYKPRLDSRNANSSLVLPATPTANRDSLGRFPSLRASATPGHHAAPAEIDTSLTSRFEKVEAASTGEFSYVFRVSRPTRASRGRTDSVSPTAITRNLSASPGQVWAVKKTKNAYMGPRDRLRKLEEVKILKALEHADHTIHYVDCWEYNQHLYIQTEFCEEGSLDKFLQRTGENGRLDDFRIWKIMLELSQGLKQIHDAGFIHLDLKPANILITFEGVLKIADFGLATSWPAAPDFEGEGDREYIGPEILRGKFDKPGDVFAFGLIMLEIAGNVVLPDNGVSWQRLRSGDMSDVGSLTSSSAVSNLSRDTSGNPISQIELPRPLIYTSSGASAFSAFDFGFDEKSQVGTTVSPPRRAGELQIPPEFMVNADHTSALDRVVRCMISPEPADRPVVDEILAMEGICWTGARRRAGATIYEGNFGPADHVLQDDAEMIDV